MGGVPVIKSSVRADQDPVNQAACESIRAMASEEITGKFTTNS